MKRFACFFCLMLAAGTLTASAQVAPAATTGRMSLTAGGTVSLYQPDFEGDWLDGIHPTAETSQNWLVGAGAYVDFRFTRWVQIEAEGRWQRWNQFANIHEDNYLIGPRVPIHRFWKADIYGKALIGFSNMTFDEEGDHGRFTTAAFGGGADIRMTRKISIRLIDAEYQYWPKWGNSSLNPYGFSMGVGYKIF